MLEFIAQLHWGALVQIVVVDVLLGGDNAVVIALACRQLDPHQRLKGILWGTLGAITLRVVLIAFALALLNLPFLKLAGALLLLWIGVRLMLPDRESHEHIRGARSVWAAVRTIIVADLVMSLDNVLGIAAAAQNAVPDHQLAYVIFGLAFSVPLIVWGSTLVLKLIDRFPQTVTLGAGLLGWIAGGMLVGDRALSAWLSVPDVPVKLIAEVVGAALVMGCGTVLARRRVAARKLL